MFTQTQTTSNMTITTWWQQMQTRLKLSLHLLQDDAPPLWKLENPEGFLLHLKRSYELTSKVECPVGAGRMRAHLLNAIHYLMESLSKPDRASFESQVRLDVARAEYSMLVGELMEHGIYEAIPA